jgi:hypothetical protein
MKWNEIRWDEMHEFADQLHDIMYFAMKYLSVWTNDEKIISAQPFSAELKMLIDAMKTKIAETNATIGKLMN